MSKKHLIQIGIIISLIIVGIGVLYFIPKFLSKKVEQQPPTIITLPKPQISTSTPISFEPYSLLRKEDLTKAELIWQDEPTGGITFSKLSLGTKIYMPFDGYASPFLNTFYGADQIIINDPNKQIEITLVGYFTSTDEIKTGGDLIKKGTPIAVLDKKPRKPNTWKIYDPFLIIYSYSNKKPDFSILKNLFPDYVK